MRNSNIRLFAPVGFLVIAMSLLMALAALPAAAEQDMVELTFTWDEPTERENGDPMQPDEIGGYEFRFYEQGADEADAVVIPREGEPITGYTIMVPEGEHEYSIAAFDTNGLYSEFVSLTASVNRPSRPGSALGFDLEVVRPSVDRVAECRDDRPGCVVLDSD